jgi:diguanylate cyclase (GGDEF)-like protein
MIIDRQAGETLFTASHGLSDDVGTGMALGDLDEEQMTVDGMLKCIPLLTHEKITAVLCAGAAAIDDFTEDDMLVLSAIASELAVAIDNAQLYKLTKRLAVTDELTGLSNYRYLRQRLDLEIDRAQRYLRPVSLLMIDVDDFKGHNDAFGHASGDRVLSELAQVLRQKCRDLDVVARYGGEEFSVILPETDASGAFVVAEKLRESVSVHRFEGEVGQRECHLSISIGVATYPIHAGSAEELLKQADDALYKAKGTGRNKVCSPPKERAVT